MHKSQLLEQIQKNYGIEAEYPWKTAPDFAVFRHTHNDKWFAVLLYVPANKIGLPSEKIITLLNVKARPEYIGSLRTLRGIYPAYHMNKEHWLSLKLDELDDDLVMQLLDESFSLTFRSKIRTNKHTHLA